MPAEVPPGADESGFSDLSFDARYEREAAGAARSDRTGASAPRPASIAPRSRNSFMRTRARRLSASRPT